MNTNTIQYPSGKFTKKDLVTNNANLKPAKVAALFNKDVASGKVIKTDETVKTGTKGRPQFQYMVAEVKSFTVEVPATPEKVVATSETTVVA